MKRAAWKAPEEGGAAKKPKRNNRQGGKGDKGGKGGTRRGIKIKAGRRTKGPCHTEGSGIR